MKFLGKEIDAYLDIEGLTENIKQETVAKFISEVTEQDGIGNKITLNEETMDKVEDSLIEKMDNTTDVDEKRDLQLAINCIEDKRKEINGQEKLNVYSKYLGLSITKSNSPINSCTLALNPRLKSNKPNPFDSLLKFPSIP